MQMMIGVDKIKDGVLTEETLSELLSSIDSNGSGKKKKDKDSIYWTTIQIDQTLLNYLEDPNLTTVDSVLENLRELMLNEIFIDMIKKEIKVRARAKAKFMAELLENVSEGSDMEKP